MQIEYSKEFIKNASKLTGKMRDSLARVIQEVRTADEVQQLTDCKRLKDFRSIYRIRIGDKRAFFQFHVKISGNTVYFILIANRGQAYSKETIQKLKKLDLN